jgi:hypothetical protein
MVTKLLTAPALAAVLMRSMAPSLAPAQKGPERLLYNNLFVHRQDIYARQKPDGSYFLCRSSITGEVIRSHLTGKITAGFYALDQASTASWGVVDADSPDGLEKIQAVWHRFHELGIPAYIEQSRRGGHLWLFPESPLPGARVRELLKTGVGELEGLELYPKQDRLDRSRTVGSLIRGPLGVHLLSGKRYPFLDPVSLQPVSPTVGGTIDFLGTVEKVSLGKVAEVMASRKLELEHRPRPRSLRDRPLPTRNVSPVERAKLSLGDLRSFAERYTKLDGAGLGSCPLHPPDYHPSFALTDDGKRWTCFHENIGGDVLDLYMRLEGLSSYKEAVNRITRR